MKAGQIKTAVVNRSMKEAGLGKYSKQYSIERGDGSIEEGGSLEGGRPVTAPVIEEERFHCYMKFSSANGGDSNRVRKSKE